MRVLILGGTGFIGRRVVRALRGHEIALFHRGPACRSLPHVHHIHGFRHDLASFRTLFTQFQPDVILDMIPMNGADAQLVTQSVGAISARIVSVSSGSVYRQFGLLVRTEAGPIENAPAKENAPLRRRLFPYRGREPRPADDPKRWLDDYDKIPAERVFLAQSDLVCSIVRLPMVYGPGDPDRRIASYLRRMVDDRPAILLGETAARWRNARAFVDNAAAAIARVVERGAPGRVYNVAELDDFTEAAWIRLIGKQVNWTGTIRVVPDDRALGRPAIDELPRAANFAQHLRMDSTRIRRELEYAEVVPLDEALRSTVRDTIKSLPVIDYRAEDRLLASL